MALTNEQKEQKMRELRVFIAEHKDSKGPLMPIMQKAQELFGYLSLETQSVIADSLGIPVSEVYGVATFYVLPRAQGRKRHKHMHRYRLLCQGGSGRCGRGRKGAWNSLRKDKQGRQIHPSGYAMSRVLRSCAGYGCERGRLRQGHSRNG